MPTRPPSGHRGTDDANSFIADKNGEVARNITGSVDIEGGNIEATPSGLTIAFKISTFEVTDTASALPGTPLTDRNSLSIRNLDLNEVLYLGGATVEANDDIGLTAGWQVGPNETINLDLKDTIIVYGIVESGKTIKVQTFEAA